MKKVVLVTLIISLAIYAGEGWVRWYGNKEADVGFSICEAHSNGWLITGFTNTYEDLWIVRLDTLGDTFWTRTYGKEYRDMGMCIQPASDGNFIISGEHGASWPNSIWLLKIDSTGDTIWTRSIGIGDNSEIKEGGGRWLEETSDGGFIIIGSSGDEAFLVKTDSLGDTIWTHVLKEYWGSSGGLCVQQTNDDGYAFTGFENPKPGYEFGYPGLIKTDAKGNLSWASHYGDNFGCSYYMTKTKDGGYAIPTSIALFKADFELSTQWVKEGSFYSVHQTNDGGYIASGVPKNRNLSLQRLDKNGNELWSRLYNGVGTSLWFSTFPVLETSDGGFITVGARQDMCVIKTNSLGELPLEVSPRTITSPQEGHALHTVMPQVEFANFGMPDRATAFYYHCEITDLKDSSIVYHDSAFEEKDLSPWQYKSITFAEWTAPTISDFKCTFYTTGAGRTQPMSVNFSWTGVSEPVTHQPSSPSSEMEILSPIGSTVTLRYSNCPGGFSASVFDASGRKVDEIKSTAASGTIEWGKCYGPGVYFIVPDAGSKQVAKVVLVK